VLDFDMYCDERLFAYAPARLLEIAAEAPPIFWTPRHGGLWFVCRFRLVTAAARDWGSFSSQHIPRELVEATLAGRPEDSPGVLLPVPILLDPPEHTAFRKPLNAALAPKTMMALQDDIRALSIEMIERISPNGACEFMAEVAEPIPVHVFLRIFGLPLDRQHEFRALAKEHLSQDPGDHESAQRRMGRIAAVLKDTLLERRESPRDDLISVLWQSTVNGRSLSLSDMQNYAILLFIAGLDTVMNAMGHGVRHLAEHPELQEALRAEPALIPEAAEELLRRYGFVQSTRIVARDLEYEGVAMNRGERVILYNPVANLDADEFAEPGAYDLSREHKAHITFGAGPHRCVGSHLARIELHALYEELLARLPPFRLDPERPVRYRCGPVIGPEAIHLRWD
jgi:cytochrome P450